MSHASRRKADTVKEPEEVQWWRNPPYRLQVRTCLRRNSNEVAGHAVMILREHPGSGGVPAEILAAFTTAGGASAGHTLFMANAAVESPRLLDTWRESAAQAMLDWRDEIEQPGRLYTLGTDVYDDAYGDLAEVHRFISKNLPVDDYLRILFDIICPDVVDRDDYNKPPLPAIRRALAAFHRSDEQKKRKILNGWAGASIGRMDREEWNAMSATRDLAGYLVAAEPGCKWTFETEVARDLFPVRLTVRAGTPQSEVLESLERWRAEARSLWPALITNPDKADYESVGEPRARAEKQQPAPAPADVIEEPDLSSRKIDRPELAALQHGAPSKDVERNRRGTRDNPLFELYCGFLVPAPFGAAADGKRFLNERQAAKYVGVRLETIRELYERLTAPQGHRPGKEVRA